MRTRAALSRYVFLPVSCLLMVYRRSKSISLYHLPASWLRPDVSNPTADHRLVVVSSPGQMFRIQQPITGSLLYRLQRRLRIRTSQPPSDITDFAASRHLSSPDSKVRTHNSTRRVTKSFGEGLDQQQDAAHCRWHRVGIPGQPNFGDCSKGLLGHYSGSWSSATELKLFGSPTTGGAFLNIASHRQVPRAKKTIVPPVFCSSLAGVTVGRSTFFQRRGCVLWP
jgi:hypothetical protein